MATIVTRAGKGSPLTNAEVDANFTNLNTELLGKQDALGFTPANKAGDTFTGNIQVANGTDSRVNLQVSGVTEGILTASSTNVRLSSANAIPITIGTNGVTRLTFTGTGFITTGASEYLGVGAQAGTNQALRVARNLENGTSAYGVTSDGTFQAGVTTTGAQYRSVARTAASAFTMTALHHFQAVQATLGAGSAITTQAGYVADSTLVGATNNYGFFGNIPSGTGRFNLYMSGTAANYLAGALQVDGGITGNLTGNVTGNVSGNVSGTAASITGVYGGTLTSGQVTTALGFTPYNATNPSGYTSNTGTVTSVGGTGTVSGLSLSGTVTTSGNLTLGGTLAVTPSNFASQTANTILAAPNGAAGVPTFRALVAADIPTLNQNTTGTAANVTGTVAIANGGTGATTAGAALTNLGAYAASNPSGYTSNTGTVTSVGGTGTVSGLTLTGTVTGSGNLTLGGTLSLTSGNVTGALGFTPYNATNPSGYITSSGSISGSAGSVSGLTLTSSANGINPDSVTQNQLGYNTSVSLFGQTDGGLHSSAYSSAWVHQIFGDFRTGQIAIRGKNNGTWQAWRTVLDSSNYTSYSPSLTGSGASGSWGISVTGSAGSVAWTNVSGRPTAVSSFTNDSAYITTAGARSALSFTAGSGAYNSTTGVITIPTNTNQLTNGAGFTGNTGTVTSVGGTGTVSGLTLTGTVTSSGNLTLGGTLSLTSGNVTTALGFTPYNATNPSGYITSSGNAATATTATNATNVAIAADTTSTGTFYIPYASATTGNVAMKGTRLTVQPSTGNFTAAGNVTAYSDERLKKDWAALPSDFVERLADVRSGTYSRTDSSERQAGSSAQDWQKLLPEVVMVGTDEDQTLSLAYGNAALVAAVELAKRVVRMEKLIEKLIGD
jgi:hypothetical protein